MNGTWSKSASVHRCKRGRVYRKICSFGMCAGFKLVTISRCFEDMVWYRVSVVAAFQIGLLVFRRKSSDLPKIRTLVLMEP